MIERAFAPSFPLALAAKDAGLIAEAGAATSRCPKLDPRADAQGRRRRATATRTWRRRSWPMARALVIVDFQNDFTPGGALAVPDGDEIADRHQRARRAPATTTSSSPRATGIPPDHGSFAEQGGPWPVHCVAGTQGASCIPRSTQLPVDVIVDKGQAVDTDGYSGFEGTDLEAILRERGITAGDGRRPRDRLLRQEHRAGRAAGGLPGHRRHAPPCAASRSSRATPSARWPRCAPPAA